MDPKFYSELKQLNEDLLAFLKLTHDKSHYFDFTPTLLDYVKQIDELQKQYKPSTSKIFSPAVTTSKPLPFVFGGPTGPSTIFSSPPAAPLFSFSMPKKDEDNVSSTAVNNNNPQEEDEEDAPPPAPNVEKYEEPDAKYSVRCKLYEKTKKDAELTILGIGYLYVKSLEKSKLQVIFRLDPDLRKVNMNEIITPNIPIKVATKAVQIMVPSPTGDNKIYIAKTKDEKDAQNLYDQLDLTKNVQ